MDLSFIRKDFKTHLTGNDIAEVLEKRNVYNLKGWKIPSRHEKDYYVRLIELDGQHFIVEKYGIRIKGEILPDSPTIIKLKVILNIQMTILLLCVITFISGALLMKTIIIDGIRTEPDVWDKLLFGIVGGSLSLVTLYLSLIKAQKWLIEKLSLNAVI